MTTSRRNTIMSWMAYTEFFYPGCELQPGYFYLSIPELYYIPEDGACIGAAGIDAYIITTDVIGIVIHTDTQFIGGRIVSHDTAL